MEGGWAEGRQEGLRRAGGRQEGLGRAGGPGWVVAAGLPRPLTQ